MHSDYAYQFTAHLADNIGPRLSGSPQYNQAAQWVADEFRRFGLAVQMEQVMVPHWVRGKETGELVRFPGMAPNTTQKLLLTALGGSVATPEEANHQAAIENDLGCGHPVGVYFDGDPAIEEIMQPAMSVLRSQGAGIIRPSETGTDILAD